MFFLFGVGRAFESLVAHLGQKTIDIIFLVFLIIILIIIALSSSSSPAAASSSSPSSSSSSSSSCSSSSSPHFHTHPHPLPILILIVILVHPHPRFHRHHHHHHHHHHHFHHHSQPFVLLRSILIIIRPGMFCFIFQDAYNSNNKNTIGLRSPPPPSPAYLGSMLSMPRLIKKRQH